MNAQLQFSSAKAERELGWRHRPLSETLRDEVAGIARTRRLWSRSPP